MERSTINKVVSSILELSPADTVGDYRDVEMVANEATIYLKTAYICEHEGIDKAMEYYTGSHSLSEYMEYEEDE